MFRNLCMRVWQRTVRNNILHLPLSSCLAKKSFATTAMLITHRGLCSSCKTKDIILFTPKPNSNLNWRKVCSDSNPRTIAFLNKHWDKIQDKIKWSHLCSNPAAIPLLDKHWDEIQDKIDFACLGVCNENVIPLLDKYHEELELIGAMDYFWINCNPHVISWLKRHYGLDDDNVRAEK